MTVDVAAARRAALALYARYPENTTDPSAGWVWSRAPVRQSPLSAAVVARLDALTRADWWSDQKCGEDYIDGNQVGLDQAPVVVSSRVDPDGSVTVVVRGSLDGRHRDLTVTVTDVDGRWTVTDLARGSGPNASIFSPAPNC